MTGKYDDVECHDDGVYLWEDRDTVEFLNEDQLCEFINKLIDKQKDANRQMQKSQEQKIQLIEKIKKLEKEIHLIHMASMFSTVKSFKGDVSKRYTYNEETDTIYDTANHYGSYHKVLDKKEIVMLLNEYETVLNKELKE